MAPKHGLNSLQPPEDNHKRAKTSSTPASRSATPAEQIGAKVPFVVHYPNVSTKKKLSKKEQELVDNAEFQVSPFVAKGRAKEGELDQHYTVTPSAEWGEMKKYNNFIIQGDTYKNNHFVYVRSDETPKEIDEENLKVFWVARILQVRAQNAQHVYALIAWMYWADELPPPKVRAPDQVSALGGKRTYHGKHELIASNYMEVLDVLSFAGKAEVVEWREEDDNIQSKLYWRQTFCRETQELSKIREHCVCKGHFNPEVSMFICDNPSCKIWLHKACLINDILKKTYTKLVGTEPETNGIAKPNGKAGKVSKSKPFDGKFSAKIKDQGDGPPTIFIKDLRSGQKLREWEESIPCPKCNAVLQ
ncbi:hypothetical protein LAWI1_G005103 [Lachnellula willkommii]|uniref:BAH domain-containing protein n=1 Tax=Lachnellula willkommii TaxID=215461 RepID=A0A559M2W5_9HELO|nr:hypothetical protein LAWI1_G005103 [Lachnellula willkommii]